MADHFPDSSALVKRYVAEIGTNWIRSLFVPPVAGDTFIAGVTGVEIIAAITRRARGATLSASDAATARVRFRSHLASSYQVIEISETLLASAMSLAETYGLRGYDAIQPAAACQVNALCLGSGLPALIFVSADNELNAAASSEGLLVENPNSHP